MIPAAWRPWILGVSASALVAAGWTANGWRLNATISQMEADHERAIAAGWQKATEKLAEERARADTIVIGAQAEARRLRAELAGRQRQFDDAIREGGECAEQALQPLVCPRPW